MKKMQTACEVLAVIDDEFLTDESRWVKHAFWTGTRDEARYCLVGVPRHLLQQRKIVYEVYTYVLRHLAAALPSGYDVVTAFNDDPKTTFDDVKGVLKRARERACADDATH